jgi:hypothetical protein
VLSIIAKTPIRGLARTPTSDVSSTELRETVGRFCANICDALRRSWLSPEERQEQEKVAAENASRLLEKAKAQACDRFLHPGPSPDCRPSAGTHSRNRRRSPSPPSKMKCRLEPGRSWPFHDMIRRKFEPNLDLGSTRVARAFLHHSPTAQSRARPSSMPQSTCRGPTAKPKVKSRNSSS